PRDERSQRLDDFSTEDRVTAVGNLKSPQANILKPVLLNINANSPPEGLRQERGLSPDSAGPLVPDLSSN
ncbi:unnamed protein product, partial [Amoebophrya sp. A25]